MTEEVMTVPIDNERIAGLIQDGVENASRVREILDKALQLKGLDEHDVSVLMAVNSPDLLEELFDTARKAKLEIYGRRIVLFAPLYVSNLCANDCTYCAFRKGNPAVKRRALRQEEVANETRIILDQGHKRILLVAGEAYPNEGLNYIFNCIDTIYATKTEWGEIRRVNVNIAPLTVDEFKELKGRKIGTYQLFQETYHRDTYMKVHVAGKKRDFDWRISAMDRAMEAGIDDVGIGVLFGLADWRFEMLALMQHIAHLEKKFGVGPHTISVPRIEPALGVSQISAGSRTNPGGYNDNEQFDTSQFSLGDHRTLDEVVADVTSMGYIPSFCTGCYRMKRTGKDFMDLAKPGLIKNYCDVNALSTFTEFLEHYASPGTKKTGDALVETVLNEMPPSRMKRAKALVEEVRAGGRDVYV